MKQFIAQSSHTPQKLSCSTETKPTIINKRLKSTEKADTPSSLRNTLKRDLLQTSCGGGALNQNQQRSSQNKRPKPTIPHTSMVTWVAGHDIHTNTTIVCNLAQTHNNDCVKQLLEGPVWRASPNHVHMRQSQTRHVAKISMPPNTTC